MDRAEYCEGAHRFFLASEVELPDTGEIVLLAFCTACGEPRKLRYQVLEKGK